mgnify:CR=1 FL=1
MVLERCFLGGFSIGFCVDWLLGFKYEGVVISAVVEVNWLFLLVLETGEKS